MNYEDARYEIPSDIVATAKASISGSMTGLDLVLKEIEIFEDTQSIADRAFYNETGIRKVTCHATTPPTLGTDVFGIDSGVSQVRTLEVPSDSISLYEREWGSNWHIVAISE